MKVDLPVLEVVPALREKLENHPIVILQAPPGAGKSTALPLELLHERWLAGKKMIMLEPRRLAARSVAERLASQLSIEGGKETVGLTVGYRVRFDTKVSAKTRIEVVTEGILTRMIQSDNSLDDVGLLIFDEFHERSLHADLALALSLQIQNLIRPDLKILIMSATIDSGRLSVMLGHAPVITSEGRQYPVETRYDAMDSDTAIVVRMAQMLRKVMREEQGDILAFLPGAGEIRRVQEILEEEGVAAKIHPLYGDLPFQQQQEAILPRKDGLRKIVLATSIAETSLTIEGIRIVVDSGLSRVPRFDPRSGLTRLETVPVTKDAADQRTGRAGRLGPGICYRLWSEGTHRNLQPQRKPEILEADLAPLMLELSQWGVKDIMTLTWLTSPPAGAVSQAQEILRQLGAVDMHGITPRGKAILRLPTHPRIAHMLEGTFSQSERSKALATDIAALLEERDPLPKDSGADITLRLEAFRKWRKGERVQADRNVLDRVERLAQNWRKQLNLSQDNEVIGDHEAGKLLMTAYPERIACQQSRQGEVYTLSNGRVARLPAHDPLKHEPWICIAQLDAGQKEGRVFLAAPVDESDLVPLSSESENGAGDSGGEEGFLSLPECPKGRRKAGRRERARGRAGEQGNAVSL
ncbi:MAG TPA: ATP-dependent helicase HrpB [Cyclobacteriaceae bacterium]|nr:ATP-dependent helicase HrpB [Cyclobacteriaceae bacterium]